MELLALQTSSVLETEHLDYIGPVFKFQVKMALFLSLYCKECFRLAPRLKIH